MHDTRAAVLSGLSAGPVSGPALADELGVSRVAVWKHVEELRDAGFEIASVEGGYELRSVPEFGGLAVEYGLDAPFEVEYHDEITSTNDRARELAGEGATDVVVLADRQTAGRGRLDRSWSSPSGGVWLSVVCRPEIPPARVPLFTLAAAVATARAARETGVDAGIKWPNDVLVGDRKLAGVLTEMKGEADRVSWLVAGVGVNANVASAALPADRSATSLLVERGEPVDRRTVTQRLLAEFAALRADPDAILPAWRDLAVTLGKHVRVATPGGEIEGRAVDVVAPGALVIEGDDGRRTVTAGDCEHLRPAED